MPRKRLVGQSGGAAVWGFVEDPSRLEATLHKFWNGSERPEIAIAAAVTSPDPAGTEQEAAASETRGAASIRMIDEDCFEVRPPEALESLASQS
jgi:hypothetical protein